MVKPGLKCVNLRGLNIFNQLQLEEVLLRHTSDNWLIFNSQIPLKTIVVGFSGKILELLNVDLCSKDNVNVIRRYSGGGTVIVDHNTVFVSFIMNANDAATRPYPREIMTWSEEIYKPLFENRAICGEKFALRENDYVLGNKKFGGNAQTLIKDRWVHHTSFLWDFDPLNMKYLAMPKKRPDYRENRSHEEFLTTMKSLFPTQMSFNLALQGELSKIYQLEVIDTSDVDKYVRDILGNKEISSLSRTIPEVIVSNP